VQDTAFVGRFCLLNVVLWFRRVFTIALRRRFAFTIGRFVKLRIVVGVDD
jgi:hypothetical protein